MRQLLVCHPFRWTNVRLPLFTLHGFNSNKSHWRLPVERSSNNSGLYLSDGAETDEDRKLGSPANPSGAEYDKGENKQ